MPVCTFWNVQKRFSLPASILHCLAKRSPSSQQLRQSDDPSGEQSTKCTCLRTLMDAIVVFLHVVEHDVASSWCHKPHFQVAHGGHRSDNVFVEHSDNLCSCSSRMVRKNNGDNHGKHVDELLGRVSEETNFPPASPAAR